MSYNVFNNILSLTTISSGTTTGAVSSVAGRTGAITLTATDIPDFQSNVSSNTNVATHILRTQNIDEKTSTTNLTKFNGQVSSSKISANEYRESTGTHGFDLTAIGKLTFTSSEYKTLQNAMVSLHTDGTLQKSTGTLAPTGELEITNVEIPKTVAPPNAQAGKLKLFSSSVDSKLHTIDEVGVDSILGDGNVKGAVSSADNAVARFDGTTGKILENSSVLISDTGEVSRVQRFTCLTELRLGKGAGGVSFNVDNGNTYIGDACAQNFTSGYSNTFVGEGSASAVTVCNNNTCLGRQAGAGTTTGSSNTFIGESAHQITGTGTQNVALGCRSLVSGNNCIAIGYNVGYTTTAIPSNQCCIGNTA